MDKKYLEIILFKIREIFTPECRIFVHRRPVKMAKENFLLVFVERTQFLNVILYSLFYLVQSLQ
jgi:hypothetical protein